MRRLIHVSSCIALSAACGAEDSTQILEEAPSEETIAVAHFELKSS